jgi:hypothetical protein
MRSHLIGCCVTPRQEHMSSTAHGTEANNTPLTADPATAHYQVCLHVKTSALHASITHCMQACASRVHACFTLMESLSEAYRTHQLPHDLALRITCILEPCFDDLLGTSAVRLLSAATTVSATHASASHPGTHATQSVIHANMPLANSATHTVQAPVQRSPFSDLGTASADSHDTQQTPAQHLTQPDPSASVRPSGHLQDVAAHVEGQYVIVRKNPHRKLVCCRHCEQKGLVERNRDILTALEDARLAHGTVTR